MCVCARACVRVCVCVCVWVWVCVRVWVWVWVWVIEPHLNIRNFLEVLARFARGVGGDQPPYHHPCLCVCARVFGCVWVCGCVGVRAGAGMSVCLRLCPCEGEGVCVIEPHLDIGNFL